jgi:hypothetical protein
VLNQLMVGARSYKIRTLADFTDWPAKLGGPFGVPGWPTMYAGNFADGDNIRLKPTGIVLNKRSEHRRHELQFGKWRKSTTICELQRMRAALRQQLTGLWNATGEQQDAFAGTGSPACFGPAGLLVHPV